jgi:hypothetical protein
MSLASNKNMNDIAMDVEIDSDAVDDDKVVVDVIAVALEAFTTDLKTPYSSVPWGIIKMTIQSYSTSSMS